MDWLEFISSITNSLAWPSATIILIIILRKPLCELIPYLRRIKYKEFELEFSETIKMAESITSKVTDLQHTNQSEDRRLLARLVDVSPRVAIVEAWRLLESKMYDIVQKKHKDELFGLKYRRLNVIDICEEDGILKKEIANMLRKIKELRNKAVHVSEFELPQSDAMSFVNVMLSVEEYLKQLNV